LFCFVFFFSSLKEMKIFLLNCVACIVVASQRELLYECQAMNSVGATNNNNNHNGNNFAPKVPKTFH